MLLLEEPTEVRVPDEIFELGALLRRDWARHHLAALNDPTAMASYFTVALDTTGPQSPTFLVASDAAYTSTQVVTCQIGTSDNPTTGYQMKIWGNVDLADNPNIQDTEGNSSWITFSTTQAVKLLAGDGIKTLSAKIRDDVWNETTVLSDSITLDTTLPVATITTGPDVTRVSKIAGKRTVSFSWTADTIFDEYKVKVVPSSGSLNTAGTAILTTNGSTNMSGVAGGYPASTAINSTLDGRDLDAASPGDGAKIVKVFIKDTAGNWST